MSKKNIVTPKNVKAFDAKTGKEIKAQKENSIWTKMASVKIDLGCGEAKQGPDWIGVDFRKSPNVDVVQNLKLFPWKEIPSEVASLVMASHLMEHITKDSSNPQLSALIHLLEKKGLVTEKEISDSVGDHQFLTTFGRFMDEVWRITKYDGVFMISVPYAGSHGFHQDPSHTSPINESTLAYFDPLAKNPDHTMSNLYTIYRFMPWEILECNINPGGNLEAALRKRRIDPSYRVEDNSKTN